MKILFRSDYKFGSNPGAIFDFAKTNNQLECFYQSKDFSNFKKHEHFDIAVTNNGRHLANINAKLKVNTAHGNLFLGDTKPEPQYNISLLLAMSESEKQLVVKNGYNENNVLITGYPRLDKLFEFKNNKNKRRGYLLNIGLDPNNKTILYAPTYDRAAFGNGTKGFYARWCSKEEEIIATKTLVDFIKKNNYNLITRVHGYYKRHYREQLCPSYLENYLNSKNCHLTSHHDEPDTILPLLSSDILITDFSSITNDFMVLKKPIIFIEPWANWRYTDKWHCKKEERNQIGTIVKTPQKLCHHIMESKVNPNLDKMINKYNPYFDGQSSKRALHSILMEYEKKYGTKKILE